MTRPVLLAEGALLILSGWLIPAGARAIVELLVIVGWWKRK
jgi:hypothetical protein